MYRTTLLQANFQRRPQRPLAWAGWLFAGIVVLLALPILCACQHRQKGTEKQGAVSEAEKAYFDKVKDQVVATIDGKDITREMLTVYSKGMGGGGLLSDKDIATGGSEVLKPLVEDMAITQVAARHADETPEGKDPETLRMAEQYKKKLLLGMLFDKEIRQKVGVPTDKDIKQYYEANTKAFLQPFDFSMRKIFVSKYANVETKEGDTLEGLAAKISGDTRLTSMILVDNDVKSPRAPNYGGRTAIPSVQPGEHLLVPLGPEGKKKKLEKIKQAEEQLKAGKSFLKVAAEFSEDEPQARGDEIKNVGATGRVVLPEIVRAAQETPLNTYSHIVETKHGYNIFLITEKRSEVPKPLAEVKDEIKKRVFTERQKETVDKYIGDLYRMPELKINYALFKDPATTDGAVVVTLGSKTYTNAEMQVPAVGKPTKTMSDQAVLTTLRDNRHLQTDLLLYKARQLKIDTSGVFQALVNGIINRYKRQAYMDLLSREEGAKEVAKQEAQDYFEKNRAEFVLPRAYTFYEMALRIPNERTTSTAAGAEMVKKLQLKCVELTQGVKDLDGFKQVVAQHSEDKAKSAKEGLAENVPESHIGPDLLKEIQSLKPGQMSRPVRQGRFVTVVWFVSSREPRQATLDDYKDDLQRVVKNAKMNRLTKDMEAKWLSEAHISMR